MNAFNTFYSKVMRYGFQRKLTKMAIKRNFVLLCMLLHYKLDEYVLNFFQPKGLVWITCRWITYKKTMQ